MTFTDEEIEDFRTRWKHAFNEEITPDQARARAAELVELYRALAGEGARSRPQTQLSTGVQV